MENNNNEMQLETTVDTEIADLSTTEMDTDAISEDMLSNFSEIETQNDLAEKEKLADLNKKLPSWSLEPPHNFVK